MIIKPEIKHKGRIQNYEIRFLMIPPLFLVKQNITLYYVRPTFLDLLNKIKQILADEITELEEFFNV